MKWRRITHEESGISCDVRNLTWRQKPLVAAMVAEVFGPTLELVGPDGKPESGTSPVAMAGALRQAVDKLDDTVLRPIFRERVQNVAGLEGVTTGEQLLEEAPDIRFILYMLNALLNESTVSDEEGKASGSPSTSSMEPTAGSGSRAPSTAPGDGASLSTAGAIPTGPPSYSKAG